VANPYVTPAIVVVSLATVGIGFYGLKLARTTSDFLVASCSFVLEIGKYGRGYDERIVPRPEPRWQRMVTVGW